MSDNSQGYMEGKIKLHEKIQLIRQSKPLPLGRCLQFPASVLLHRLFPFLYCPSLIQPVNIKMLTNLLRMLEMTENIKYNLG